MSTIAYYLFIYLSLFLFLFLSFHHFIISSHYIFYFQHPASRPRLSDSQTLRLPDYGQFIEFYFKLNTLLSSTFAFVIEHPNHPASAHRLFGKFSTSNHKAWPAWPPAASFIQMSLQIPCICSTGRKGNLIKKTTLFSTTISSTLLHSTPPQWTTCCRGDNLSPAVPPCSRPDSKPGPILLTTMTHLLRPL